MLLKKDVDILHGPIYKALIFFFLPILFGTFFQQLYNTVDAIVVGQFVGKEALAAVGGSTSTVIDLLVGFIVGVSSGATVIIAQFYGSRDGKGVHESVKSGMFLAIIMGLIMMVVGILTAPAMLNMMNVPEEVFNYALTYMRIYYLGLIPSMIYNVGAGILRAVGDSKRPLYFLIISTLVNIVLDVLMVAVFGFNVAGAAIATILSELVSAILVLIVLSKTNDSYQYTLKDFGFNNKILNKIVTIGLPTGFQSILYTISNLFIQAYVNGFGTDTIAAYTAFGKANSIFWMVSNAFGVAVLTVVGQNFGAKQTDRVHKAVKVSTLIHATLTITISLVMYFFSGYILALFTDDQAVIDIAIIMVNFITPTWITFTLVEVLSSAIRSCGDSLFPTLITAIGICLFRVVYLLVYPIQNIEDVFRCYPISWIITSIVFLIYYYKGPWLKKCLAKREALKKINREQETDISTV